MTQDPPRWGWKELRKGVWHRLSRSGLLVAKLYRRVGRNGESYTVEVYSNLGHLIDTFGCDYVDVLTRDVLSRLPECGWTSEEV